MTRDKIKILLRRKYFKKWRNGLTKAKQVEPSVEEKHAFLTGFSMGYKAHKTKGGELDPQEEWLPDEGFSQLEVETLEAHAY